MSSPKKDRWKICKKKKKDETRKVLKTVTDTDSQKYEVFKF